LCVLYSKLANRKSIMILKFISDVLIFLSSTVKFALASSAVVTGNMGISGTVSNLVDLIKNFHAAIVSLSRSVNMQACPA
jgi:hypothetical protein